MNPFTPSNNSDLETQLGELPDRVAQALLNWRKKTLDKERTEGLLFLRFKGEDKGRTSDEVKAMVRSNDERYQAVLEEIKAESEYQSLYEHLMAAKRLSGLRTAY